MFVDQAQIMIKAGKGGDGAVAFRREKYVPDGGPDGGNGGKGGDVIAKVDSGMRTLMDFRYKTHYHAPNGENGMKKNKYGKKGEHLVILVPPGTIIRDLDTGKIIADLIEPGEERVIAKGGRGGRGNTEFKTSTRQAPTFSEQGFYGQERTIVLELKMIADVGLVGFPNVGKSTLLAQVTKAKPKIANYHFTTLFPNLGVVEAIRGKSFVLADIPGLIEGAHIGIGLGHDFLRHVERTKMILHVVDVSGVEGRDPIDDFLKINEELKLYSEKLYERPQVVAANKSDLAFDDEKVQEFVKFVEKEGFKCFVVSAATGQGVEDLMKYVTEKLDTIEDIVLFDENDYLIDEDEAVIDINQIEYSVDGDLYSVIGMAIERLYYSTDFEDVESLRRFQNILMKKGVFEKLKEMGIQDGDTVKIFDLEFEYYE
ncbi:MAG: GTPase ObgE [Clostridiales bacterium]|nr:GTPase ObgE [Clostridiales bacterium]